MKGFKDSSGKFHPISDYKGVRKSRDQKLKQNGVKIRKAKFLTVATSPNNREQPTELVSDSEIEQLYKIKDVTAEPMITRRIPSNLYVNLS